MFTNRPLVDAISRRLQAHLDPIRAVGQQAYMKSALPFMGVRVPVVRRLTHAACKEHPCSNGKQFRSTVRDLFERAIYQEQRYAAVSISTFKGHDPYQTLATLPLYRTLIVQAAWWDIVDEVSQRIGLLLKRYPQKLQLTLRQWAQQDNIWLRRSSIIAQRGFKQQTDLQLLFDCIEPSLQSEEFFLRKAIGWALRDVAYSYPQAVVAYLHTNEAKVSPLTKREALKHLGQKSG